MIDLHRIVARFKEANITTVKLPVLFTLDGRFRSDAFKASEQELRKAGVHFPYMGRMGAHLDITEESESQSGAMRDGEHALDAYVRKDPVGRSGTIVALIEWVPQDPKRMPKGYGVDDFPETFFEDVMWSAVVNYYYSHS